ncbi:MAG: LysE family translocator [Pseudomonadota bacterium]
MDLTSFALFLVAALVVAAAPGPTTLQILSHALGPDRLRPISLIGGAVFANLAMVAATVLGLSALILASQTAFTALRWIGACYLIYLGIQYWRARGDGLPATGANSRWSYRRLFVQAALTSLTNPKGLVFYLAFLPQFVGPDWDPSLQLAVLGGTYIALCIVVDFGYMLAGSVLSRFVISPLFNRWKNRVTGTILVGTGLSLFRYQRA